MSQHSSSIVPTTSRTGRRIAVAVASTTLLLGATGLYAFTTAPHEGNPYAVTQFLIGVSAVTVGGWVAYRRPDHPLGWVTMAGGAFSFVTFAGFSIINWLFLNAPDQRLLMKVVLHSSTWGWIASRGCFMVLVPLTYPNGWPTTRSGRVGLVAATLTFVVTAVAHGRLMTMEYFDGRSPVGTARLAEWILPWAAWASYVAGIAALVSMMVRVVRLPAGDRRRYLPFALGLLLLLVPTAAALYRDAVGHDFWNWTESFEGWATGLLPLVLAEGVLRRGVLDAAVVVRRLTVYALVFGLAAVAYVTVVAVASAFVEDGTGAGPIVATGIVALGVVPLRAWVEGVVVRRLFGNRDAPLAAVAALGTRLEGAPTGGGALQLVAETVREQLRAPYVAVELLGVDSVDEAAAAGVPGPPVVRFPLLYGGQMQGSLVVAQRSDREPFRASERELLANLARQAGVVAHDAAVSQALMQSRAILMETREAERHRIRRDLHDGLGPTLATVSLSLGAAAERLGDDPELAVLLRDLDTEVQHSIADIRRLVYDLRPPVLDDLGLIAALRGQAQQLSPAASVGGVAIEVATSGSDAALPAAVELAAYRVAVEAMTNVVRHAQASWCRVAVERDERLVVRVEDDGVGMQPDTPRGVGLRSMRERVLELGGHLRFEARVPSGTTVWASFPLEGVV